MVPGTGKRHEGEVGNLNIVGASVNEDGSIPLGSKDARPLYDIGTSWTVFRIFV